MDFLPPPADRSGLQIDVELADLPLSGRELRRAAAQERADPGQQFRNAERLDDVVVGTRVEQPHLFPFLALDRQHEHRRARPGAQLADEFQAVHFRHRVIGDHEVETVPAEGRESLASAGRRLDLVKIAPQSVGNDVPEILVVVDDENPAHSAPTGSRIWKRVPPRSGLESARLPPFSSTRLRAI